MGRQKDSWIGVIGMVAVTACLLIAMWPLGRGSRGPHPVSWCASNMRDIGHALHIYANEHGERFPVTLDALVAEGYISQQQLRCPSLPPDPNDAVGSYVYITGHTVYDDSRNIVMYEHPGHHPECTFYTQVMFADASVRSIETVEEFDTRLSETYERLAVRWANDLHERNAKLPKRTGEASERTDRDGG